ncbi:cysteate synthase, partial [Methanosalsum natronophilum]
GVRDALESTNGLIYPIENYQAQKGQHLFEELEGIDINPASAVAVASLIQAVKLGHVGSDETILLNITGGGKERLKRDMNLRPLEVSHSISVGEEDIEMKIIDKVSEVLRLKRQQGEL